MHFLITTLASHSLGIVSLLRYLSTFVIKAQTLRADTFYCKTLHLEILKSF
jgi:hypothetical protein